MRFTTPLVTVAMAGGLMLDACNLVTPACAQYVGKEQWSEIYAEMSSCNTAMGYCADVSAAGIRVESSLTSKEACLSGSQYVWRQPYISSTALSVDVVKRVLSPETSSAVDLFAVRRSDGLPVTGNLTRTVANNILNGSVEGYAHCGGREYLFVFGRADIVYSIIAETHDMVRGSLQKSFDLAFPVPVKLRTSPIVAEYFKRNDVQQHNSNNTNDQSGSCPSTTPIDDVDGTVPTVKASWQQQQQQQQQELDQIMMDPDCHGPKTIGLRAVLAGTSHALDEVALQNNIAVADALERELRTAGKRRRRLKSNAAQTSHGQEQDDDGIDAQVVPTVRATSARHLLISGLTVDHSRLLFDEDAAVEAVLVGYNSTLVWMEVQEVFSPQAMDAAMLMQSGQVRQAGLNITSAEEAHEAATTKTTVTPFWARGITGKNQIVGIGDTGLDTEHCAFRDASVKTNVKRPRRQVQSYYNETIHRKIAQFISYTDGQVFDSSDASSNIDNDDDSVDTTDEKARWYDHGTHVASIVAGSNGGSGSISTSSSIPFSPSDDDDDDGDDDEEDEDPSYALQQHQQRGMAYDAKLVFMDVGGVDAVTGKAFLEIPDDLEQEYLQPQYDGGARILLSSWGTKGKNYYSETARGFDAFSWSKQDILAVASVGNGGFKRGAQGSISTPSVAKNVLSVGASLSSDASFEYEQNSLDSMQADNNNNNNKDVNGGYDVDGNSTHKNASMPYYPLSCGNFSDSSPCESGMAFFSSNGPTYDSRVGVDVVAPGLFVMAAASNTECGIIPMAGTSMAAAVMAGNLALVRQYVTDGWYPGGRAVPGQGFEPMGALLKAVAINSGTELTGAYEQGGASDALNYTSIPNRDYGFGRVDLSSTLLLDGYSPPSQALYMDGDFADMPIVDNWLSVTYTFNALLLNTDTTKDADGNVKVTLVWHDPPAMPAARSALVNDLDLVVLSGTQQYWSNRLNERDSVNNVEQVIIPQGMLAQDNFTVKVVGMRVPLGPQPYALVVSGHHFEFLNKTANWIEFEEQSLVTETATPSDGYFVGWAIGGLATGTILLIVGTLLVRRRRRANGDDDDDDDDDGGGSGNTKRHRGMVGQPPPIGRQTDDK